MGIFRSWLNIGITWEDLKKKKINIGSPPDHLSQNLQCWGLDVNTFK